jgi:acyl dehydratase
MSSVPEFFDGASGHDGAIDDGGRKASSGARDGLDVVTEGATTAELVSEFLDLTGDENPLHSDVEFAQSRGFTAPLVPAGVTSALIMLAIGDRHDEDASDVEFVFVHPLLVGEGFRIRAAATGVYAVLERADGTPCVVMRLKPSGGGDLNQ